MIWKYIKENNLQDPKDGRKILCDEPLHSLFRVKSINMFQMNKALSKHIWPLGDANGIFPCHDTLHVIRSVFMMIIELCLRMSS